MSDFYIGDPSFKYPIMVASIPTANGLYSYNSGTLNATTNYIVTWTTIPSRSQLSLWNFHWTVRFGSDTAAHEWPNGASLTADQRNVNITSYTDAINSNDATNVRVNRIRMVNESASSFAFYMYFKSYSFATNVGSTS